MGGVNSYCIGRCVTTADAPENHIARKKKGKGCRRNISMTFMQFDNPAVNHTAANTPNDSIVEGGHLININTATEEELMTLPGVNRERARNIVAYRVQLGGLGFRKVEDLVLVPEIGGDRLAALLPEISVGNPPSMSNGHHPPGGVMAAMSPNSPPRQPRLVPVNTANVFQLMKVPSITQRQAEALVAYRQRYGRFENLDDLVRVKGFDGTTLQAIRHRLVLDPVLTSGSDSGCSSVGVGIGVTNAASRRRRRGNSSSADSAAISLGAASCGSGPPAATTPGDPPNQPALTKLGQMFSPSQLDLICALAGDGVASLKQRVERPQVTVEDNEHLLVASWNLERLTVDKAANPGVREVFCMTLLENRLGIVALQEVVDPKAVETLVNELNNPSLPTVRRWRGRRGIWQCKVSETPCGRQFRAPEYGAVVWDCTAGIRLRSAAPLTVAGTTTFCRSPFMGHFEVGDSSQELLLVSVHLKAQPLGSSSQEEARTTAEAESLICLAAAILQQRDAGKCALLIAGDFNLPSQHDGFTDLHANGLQPLLYQDVRRNSQDTVPTNTAGTRAVDNIWAGGAAQRLATGKSGVIREGLSHPFIPSSNFGWNGKLSDHCPVWCELHLDSTS